MPDRDAPGDRTADEDTDFQAIASLEPFRDDESLVTALLEDWGDSYGEGREQVLRRLAELRSLAPDQDCRRAGETFFRSLVRLGESSTDMRFVHLAIEGRDILHGILVLEDEP